MAFSAFIFTPLLSDSCLSTCTSLWPPECSPPLDMMCTEVLCLCEPLCIFFLAGWLLLRPPLARMELVAPGAPTVPRGSAGSLCHPLMTLCYLQRCSPPSSLAKRSAACLHFFCFLLSDSVSSALQYSRDILWTVLNTLTCACSPPSFRC